MSELARMAADYGTVEIVIGLPVTLTGAEGHAAQHARAYAQRLAAVVTPIPVTLTDERMSTVLATRRLAERGVRGSRQRKVVDQVAAAEILQGWLDARRRTGT
jgi:putative holliday junction resolvase